MEKNSKNSQPIRGQNSLTSLSEVSCVPDWVQKSPKTLNELLIASTVMTGGLSENKAAGTSNKVENEEAKKFLKESLDECFSQSTHVLQLYLDIIKNADKNEIDCVLSALEDVQYCVVQIDQAMDFYKMGGLEALKPLLKHSDCYIRQESMQIIKECCANNPFCQQQSIGDDVLGQLITNALDSTDVKHQTKAVTAITAIVRDNSAAFLNFHKHNGFTVLKKGLASEHSILPARTANLISAIVHTDKRCELIIEQDLVEKLISLVRKCQTCEGEYFILALTALLTAYEGTRDICLNDRHLRLSLENLINSQDGLPGCEELVYYAKELCRLMDTYRQEKKKPCAS